MTAGFESNSESIRDTYERLKEEYKQADDTYQAFKRSHILQRGDRLDDEDPQVKQLRADRDAAYTRMEDLRKQYGL